MTKPVLYADLIPNVVVGKHSDLYDQKMADKWKTIFKDSPEGDTGNGAQAASIGMVLAMRAMLTSVAPRPPGNVHARQKIRMHTLPKLNETIHSEITCLNKEIKRERRYVDFGVIGKNAEGHLVYEARMSLIWAA